MQKNTGECFQMFTVILEGNVWYCLVPGSRLKLDLIRKTGCSRKMIYNSINFKETKLYYFSYIYIDLFISNKVKYWYKFNRLNK